MASRKAEKEQKRLERMERERIEQIKEQNKLSNRVANVLHKMNSFLGSVFLSLFFILLLLCLLNFLESDLIQRDINFHYLYIAILITLSISFVYSVLKKNDDEDDDWKITYFLFKLIGLFYISLMAIFFIPSNYDTILSLKKDLILYEKGEYESITVSLDDVEVEVGSSHSKGRPTTYYLEGVFAGDDLYLNAKYDRKIGVEDMGLHFVLDSNETGELLSDLGDEITFYYLPNTHSIIDYDIH